MNKTDDGSNSKDELVLLVLNCQEDQNCFSDLYRLFINPIFAYILGMVGDVALAEDLASETFMKALKQIRQLRQPEKVSSWLIRIARNITMDHFRNHYRNKSISLDSDIDYEIVATDQSEALETQSDLLKVVRQLNEKERELILLKFYSDLTFREIAEILRRPESSIKRDVYQTLTRMKTMMEDKNEI